MRRNLQINKITGIAILGALVVVLQLFSNYVQFGSVSITLSLIPIVVGAVIYGPLTGFILGALCGVLVFVAPSTMALFWEYGVITTFFVCVLKMGIAGLASGILYKLLYKKNNSVAAVVASVIVPIVNTGLFAIAAYLFYYDLLDGFAAGQNVVAFLFLSFIGINFIIELFVNSILSTVVVRLTNVEKLKKDK
ncbi:MAG: ECF transporter S component [Bacilli bacterium]|nr:ECF transporter S component [Bacilli bacterium]